MITMPKKQKSPAFQFYGNDWLSDRVLVTFPPALKGAYIDLMCYAWQDPKCRVPNCDKTLGVWSGLGYDEWVANKSKMLLVFPVDQRNKAFLFNKRLRLEKNKQRLRSKQCSENGVKSGVARRNKTNLGSTNGVTKTNPSSSTSSSSPSSNITNNVITEPLKEPEDIIQPSEQTMNKAKMDNFIADIAKTVRID